MDIISQHSDEQAKEVLAACAADPRLLAKIIFPETYFLEFSKLHDKIFEPIMRGDKKVVISAARSFGKTSIARLIAMDAILFRRARFICYIGLSATFAEMQTENIKMELTGNNIVKALFGDIAMNYYGLGGGGSTQFSTKAWVANGYTFVLPRGSGQQIRGLNWLRYRPDLFIIDDLEDKDEIDNEVLRAQLKEWFYSDVLKAKAIGGDARFIYIDTVKHHDALILDLMDSPEWTRVVLPICDDNFKTLAPDFKPQADLDSDLAEHRRTHMMDSFYREFLCQPIAGESKAFKEEYFQYYSETDEDFQNQLSQCITVVIVDPAKTVKLDSAHSGIAVWSVNLRTNKMYIRYAAGEFYHPDELISAAFDLAEQFNCDAMAWEETSLNEFIKHPVLNEMSRRGVNYPTIWLNPRRDKKDDVKGDIAGKAGRVASLISYYRLGQVYHNKANCLQLESQLLSFPKPKRWDVMDAACYIVQIMQDGDLFMDQELEPGADDEEIYSSIEEEAALTNWRVV